ncbi:MAG: hypothetical protein WCX73_03335 [Candidatus Pacearchaeota archaeon]|jgi:hypothetical protein
MFRFPKQSIDKANNIISEYKKRTNSDLEIATYMYSGKFIEFSYGFSEAIKSGDCGKFFHEIKKECNCFTYAGILYLLAKQAGLNPKIYEGYGIKDINEGITGEGIAPNNHAFITVNLQKGKTHIIDPNYQMFGTVKFNKNTNEIKIYNSEKEIITRSYSHLKELSEQEYLSRLNFAKSSAGGKKALLGTQKISSDSLTIFLTSLPESNAIKSSVHLERALFGPEPFNRHYIIDLTTKINENRKLNFPESTLNFYGVKNAGWSEHDFQQVPLTIPLKTAEIVWNLFENLARADGRKSPAHKMSIFRLEDHLENQGLRDDFSVIKGSFAQKLISASHSNFECFNNEKERIINEFLPECRKDELSYKYLLKEAQYLKEKNLRKNKDNPKGYIFSNDEHLAELKKMFKDFRKHSANLFRSMVKGTAIKVGLEKGNDYSADRLSKPAVNNYDEKVKYFNKIAVTYKFNTASGFHRLVDAFMFERNIDIENASIERLKEGLTEEVIREAVNLRVYSGIINSFPYKNALLLTNYKKGLQKILAK